MARPIRVELPGAHYHVAARGNERKEIYRSDDDRVEFLATLALAVEEHGLRLHAYCLMPNHYAIWSREKPEPRAGAKRKSCAHRPPFKGYQINYIGVGMGFEVFCKKLHNCQSASAITLMHNMTSAGQTPVNRRPA